MNSFLKISKKTINWAVGVLVNFCAFFVAIGLGLIVPTFLETYYCRFFTCDIWLQDFTSRPEGMALNIIFILAVYYQYKNPIKDLIFKEDDETYV